ncbi:MAG TPA: glycoside hydrolase family 2 TIM barrel-domain containing protein [Puia sp.]|nr:glycoside hydrolase family 2 TIM barrel-domain containing protein [Puia sp.]
MNLKALSPWLFFPFVLILPRQLPAQSVAARGTILQYLSGTDKDHTVDWDFFCTAGRNSGSWKKIAVPSNWELQGFGEYNYGHDKVKANEQGLYKHVFRLQRDWHGKTVYLVFEGAMTDAEVKINGKPAGAVHQGGFYRFRYDITSLLKAEVDNLLEVNLSKTSANVSVNRAERNGDFWIFGGIYRPVYLEIVPATHIDRIAINAEASGDFHADVYTQHLKGGEIIQAQVQKSTGEDLGPAFSVATGAGNTQGMLQLSSHFTNPLLWSAEFPNLYQVVVSIKDRKGVIHQISKRFGFRTAELRKQDGLYVNGARIMLKGCDRHSFWPETGRTLSHAVQLLDVNLMKEMNMNAVRMSHYPPDQDFLDVCDSLGLYVLDELTGWQAAYDSTIGHKLVEELVVRDVNHPSVVIWDNGNEGGWNRSLDNDYSLYDPQGRIVIHPWERFNNTNTKHYPDYNYVRRAVTDDKDVFFPTEFMHGLYDGGAGAALDDFWKMMMANPHSAGGFIWAFLDEAVLRTDKNGIFDADGNHAPDGIVGPHREKEASFYTIKEIWSPVFIEPQPLAADFNGEIAVENRYSFTDLRQCSFGWKLVSFPSAGDKQLQYTTNASGEPGPLDLAPGKKGLLSLNLPANWSKSDALYLTAWGPGKKELFTWSWAIKEPAAVVKPAPRSPGGKAVITGDKADSLLIVESDHNKYFFDKTTGYIKKVVNSTATISLSGGPMLAGVNCTLKNFYTMHTDDGTSIVGADYEGEGSLHAKWIFTPGQLVKLAYTYMQKDSADYMGITFNYPEEKILGMKWLGRGPYRTWKNRLKGQPFGVWEKAYNNAITGELWQYPEFKGYHAAVNWVVIGNKESPFTVYTDNKDMYLQMLRPSREKGALPNNNVEPPFPEGNIGFLSGISAIGTKFQPARVMGPQSQKNPGLAAPFSGVLWFDFH